MKLYKYLQELSAAVHNGEVNTMKKAIAAKCLDCSCYQPSEIKKCVVDTCPLHPFRLGKNPYKRQRQYTDAQRAEIRDRLLAGKAKTR